jgi:hypothetical protein
MSYQKQIVAVSVLWAILLTAGSGAANAEWQRQPKLFASDGESWDFFGSSIAVSGDCMVIGANRDGDNGSASGSAYVFRFDGSTWTQQAKLLALDGEPTDFFGSCVAVSGDIAVIGAYGDDDRGFMAGSAYVFGFGGSSWTQQAKLLASDGEMLDAFGSSVAVSGQAVLVGAPGDDDKGSVGGAVYVFGLDDSNWVQQAKLYAGDGAESDSFGASLALFGETAVIGAPGNDDNGADSGSAYVFGFGEPNWIEQAKLLPSDGAVSDRFGQSTAISGNVMVIGASGDDDNGSASGSAYVFRFNGSSWAQQAKLLASDGGESDVLGGAVAVSDDTVAVNSRGSDSVYVFRYEGSRWVQETKLIQCACGPGSVFGSSVGVVNRTILVGAASDEHDGTNPGSVYVFERELSPSRLPVIAYFPDYGRDTLAIADIRYEKVTHIVYFSLVPRANGNLDTSNVNSSDLQELVTNADANGVKVLISVGGAGRSNHFSAMAANPTARDNFIAKLTQFCLDYGLDGADLDWEPVTSATDRNNYSCLVKHLDHELKPRGLMLTIAVGAYEQEIVPEAIGCFDWLAVMAYDDTPPHHSSFERATTSLSHWENYGVPRPKAMLGLPFFGINAGGTYYYYLSIVDTYHPGPEVDYIGGIGFNGINTIKQKTEYVVNNGFGGIMIWQLAQDTTDATSLLDAIHSAIPELSRADFDLDSDVDLTDYAILTSAWMAGPGDAWWNYTCDISDPQDDVVNELDLDIFSQEWLPGE